MGRPLHRETTFRFATHLFRLIKLKWVLISVFGFLAGVLIYEIDTKSELSLQTNTDENSNFISKERQLEAVAALGKLTPTGEVRKLASPVSGFGGTPRVAALFVEEGDSIKKNQLLAIFDNRPQIIAELKSIQAQIKTLEIKIKRQTEEVNRFQKAAIQGAISIVLLDSKKNQLVEYLGQQEDALARLDGLNADLYDSELRSPIEGIVLRVHTLVGERSGTNGVLEIGANQAMEALIEVYESDINRISMDQKVSLTSENGGFEDTLLGKVKRISPQVRQRNVLSTDPTGDADARIVEVVVKLDSYSSTIVRNLTGMKVIARFDPE